MNKKNYALLLVALAGILGLVVFLIRGGQSSPLQNIFQKKATVELKKTYKNPFAKETQYVNPFEKYKNPFVTNR